MEWGWRQRQLLSAITSLFLIQKESLLWLCLIFSMISGSASMGPSPIRYLLLGPASVGWTLGIPIPPTSPLGQTDAVSSSIAHLGEVASSLASQLSHRLCNQFCEPNSHFLEKCQMAFVFLTTPTLVESVKMIFKLCKDRPTRHTLLMFSAYC